MTKPPSRSRARAVPCTPQETEARIQEVQKLMFSGEFTPGKSHTELSERWGVGLKRVQDITAEASRRNRSCIGNPEEVQAAWVAMALAYCKRAETRTEEVIDKDGGVHVVSKPDLRSALKALELSAGWLGLNVQRHEHKVQVDKLSDSEIVEQLKTYGYEITVPGEDTDSGAQEPH